MGNITQSLGLATCYGENMGIPSLAMQRQQFATVESMIDEWSRE